MQEPKHKRVRSYNEPGHAHELTFSCFHGLQLLSKDRTCQWFVEAVRRAGRRVKDQHGNGVPGNNVHQLPGRSSRS